jgi:antitoxin FitA
MCCTQMHNACMPSITIRDVPDSARDELAARAASSGRSLQEYLRGELINLAQRPDPGALLHRIRERKRLTGSHLTTAQIIAARDEDRR